MEKYIDLDGKILSVFTGDNGKEYYNSIGLLHRLDGPAVEWSYGFSWHKSGKSHRIGGPAYYNPDWSSSFYYIVNDKEVYIYYICG